MGGGQIATANVIKGFNKGNFEIPTALEQKTAGTPKKVLNKSYYDMGEMAKRVFGIDIDKASNPQSTMFAAAVETELKEKQVKNISEVKAAIEKLHSGEVLTKYEENIIEDVGGYEIANRIAESKEYRAAKRIGKQIEIKRRQLEKAGVDKESSKIRAVTETLFGTERDNLQMQRAAEAKIRRLKEKHLVAVATGDEAAVRSIRKMIGEEYEQYSTVLAGNPIFNKNLIDILVNNGTISMNRKIGNIGAFASLPEKMSRKHIREIAKQYDINIEGISMIIDKNEELLNVPYAGSANTEKVGEISFFPSAFKSREELVRTLYHEIIHVKQFRQYGVAFVQNERNYFEKLAYTEEDRFIGELKRKCEL